MVSDTFCSDCFGGNGTVLIVICALLEIVMYFLYILECADKTLYAGITTDLVRRMAEHNDSKLGAKYTRARRPVKLVYSKKFRNRSTVTKAEIKIKKMSRLKKQSLIGSVVVV